ncbi:MAG: hypothetical protein K940chlam7_00386 [Chlamydiae bacterium]|nr:hypothetical protein [Chlamydiota bacterium]
MIDNNNFTIGELTGRQYSQLMSPLRKERDKNGALTERNVTWIRYTFNHVVTFIHRLFHAIFHKGHRWENDKTLLHRFTVGLDNKEQLDEVTCDAIKLLELLEKFKMDLTDIEDLYENKRGSRENSEFDKKFNAAQEEHGEEEQFPVDANNLLDLVDKFNNNGFQNISLFDDAALDAISLLGEELILRNSLECTQEVNDHLKLHNNLQHLKQIRSADQGNEKVGRRDTMHMEKRRKLLNPTYDEKVREQWLKDEKKDDVKNRRDELKKALELYRPQVEEDKRKNPERHLLVKKCLEEGEFIPTSRGCGGANFLKYGGETKFVIKANGEGTHCLHNRKTDEKDNPLNGYSISKGSRIRNGIPLYFESLSEILYYEVAKLLELEAYVPETFPAIIESKEFFDRAEDPESPQVKEKFCSAQQFTKNKGLLSEFVFFVSKDRRTLEFKKGFEGIDSFSVGANIFLDCLCGNTDRIQDNCLVGTNNELINIDNGLCFPEDNIQIRSLNVLLPEARKEKFDRRFIELIKRISNEKDPLSQRLSHLIEEAQEQHTSVNGINTNQRSRNKYVQNVMRALKQRIEIMKYAIDKGMTMSEVGLRVLALGSHEKGFAYRDEPITANDVASFHLGGDKTKRWPGVKQESKNKKVDAPKEEEGASSYSESTMVRGSVIGGEDPPQQSFLRIFDSSLSD